MKKSHTLPKKKSGKQTLPRGWTLKRVKDVIAYYDRQTEDEEASEYEAAIRINGQSVMLVPSELVPRIRRLIAEETPGGGTERPGRNKRRR